MERKFSLSHITFVNLIALTKIEGYASANYMQWVKEVGTRKDRLFLLDSQDAVEETTNNSDFTLLNIIVAKANEDRDVEFNMSRTTYEEQIPIGSPMGDPGFVLSLSQDGIVHPLEVNVNTQQSCNLNMTEAPSGDDEDVGGEDDDVDKSSLDFEFDRGDYRGMKMSYKAWKRGEDLDVNEQETYVAEDRLEFQGDTDVSQFWREEKEANSGEGTVVAKGTRENLSLEEQQ
ncbi:hypothetical protein D1007_45976 [Hordeum vulgare]|nr:hypothetical protein D1007_45976 [Hordeum vulgare]